MDIRILLSLIPLFPLLGFLINIFFYKKTKEVSGWIATLLVGLSFFCSLGVLMQLMGGKRVEAVFFPFIAIDSLKIDFGLVVDKLSGLYLLIITGVGFFIHLYSISYMHGDKAVGKYFAYLNLFVVSMLLLVMGSNYVVLFIGWEGVGLCSFLLIGFWHTDPMNTVAARKAFVMNRIGDLCFLLAMFLVLQHYGTLHFATLAEEIVKQPMDSKLIFWVTFLMFVGATGKSAQIPLYTWLPDAMAGPTPVSALIHAATMVTAGIYLIARSQFLFVLVPLTMHIIAIIGLLTALIAALIATKQRDIKKVLAYSTVSQLGFMFIALGTGAYHAAIFHVMTHAFFKALLFLGSGSVIHAMHGEQDIVKMGGLGKKMRLTQFTFLIGCFAIAGIPGFSGFFSKDAILLSAYHYHTLYFGVALFCALLTSFYMFRLYFLTFCHQFRGTEAQWKKVHESPFLILFPLVVLSILSIIGGYVNLPEVFGGHSWLSGFLSSIVKERHFPELAHTTEYILMFAPVVLIVVIFLFTRHTYARRLRIEKVESERGIGHVFAHKFYVDEIYQFFVVQPVFFIGKFFKNKLERGLIDNIVEGLGRLTIYASRKLRYWQNGKISSYIFWMVLGIIVLLSMLLFNKF